MARLISDSAEQVIPHQPFRPGVHPKIGSSNTREPVRGQNDPVDQRASDTNPQQTFRNLYSSFTDTPYFTFVCANSSSSINNMCSGRTCGPAGHGLRPHTAASENEALHDHTQQCPTLNGFSGTPAPWRSSRATLIALVEPLCGYMSLMLRKHTCMLTRRK